MKRLRCLRGAHTASSSASVSVPLLTSGGQDCPQELAFLPAGLAHHDEQEREREDREGDHAEEADRRAAADYGDRVPGAMREHPQEHQADPEAEPTGLDRRADRVDHAAAEQRAGERVGEDPGGGAQAEGPMKAPRNTPS
jgi:hypothetical protein